MSSMAALIYNQKANPNPPVQGQETRAFHRTGSDSPLAANRDVIHDFILIELSFRLWYENNNADSQRMQAFMRLVKTCHTGRRAKCYSTKKKLYITWTSAWSLSPFLYSGGQHTVAFHNNWRNPEVECYGACLICHIHKYLRAALKGPMSVIFSL